MMKVLLVNGSSHRDGYTYKELCEVSDALNENGVDTDMFWIGDKTLSDCNACKKCTYENRCISDDCVNEFLDIAGDYNGFVFGTPAYFGEISTSMASFMNRVFYTDLSNGRKRFALKPVSAVISSQTEDVSYADSHMNRYFSSAKMIIVTGRHNLHALGENMAFLVNGINIAIKMGLEFPENKYE